MSSHFRFKLIVCLQLLALYEEQQISGGTHITNMTLYNYTSALNSMQAKMGSEQ